MKVLGIIFLCAVVESARISLSEPAGVINSFTPGSDWTLYTIRAPTQHKIILQINRLILNRKSFVVLRDGRSGVENRFKKKGREIQRSYGTSTETASLPITITTQATELFLFYKAINSKEGQGFSARYAVYTEEGNCEKASLTDYDNVTEMTCDTDQLSPYASQCNITIACKPNYKQYSKTLSCESAVNIWDGSVTCKPRVDLIEKCEYNFEEMEVIDGCPFSITEVLDYYRDVEDLGVIENAELASLSRSLSAETDLRTNCADVCSFNRRGKRKRCNLGTRRGIVHCIACKIKWKCKGFNSIIGK